MSVGGGERDVERLQDAAVVGLVVVGGGFAVVAESQPAHGVGEESTGALARLLQRGWDVERVGSVSV